MVDWTDCDGSADTLNKTWNIIKDVLKEADKPLTNYEIGQIIKPFDLPAEWTTIYYRYLAEMRETLNEQGLIEIVSREKRGTTKKAWKLTPDRTGPG